MYYMLQYQLHVYIMDKSLREDKKFPVSRSCCVWVSERNFRMEPLITFIFSSFTAMASLTNNMGKKSEGYFFHLMKRVMKAMINFFF